MIVHVGRAGRVGVFCRPTGSGCIWVYHLLMDGHYRHVHLFIILKINLGLAHSNCLFHLAAVIKHISHFDDA